MGMFDDIKVEILLPSAAGWRRFNTEFQFKDMKFPSLETYYLDSEGQLWLSRPRTRVASYTGSIQIESVDAEYQLGLVNGVLRHITWRPVGLADDGSEYAWEMILWAVSMEEEPWPPSS